MTQDMNQREVSLLVVDMRYNGGGNSLLGNMLLEALNIHLSISISYGEGGNLAASKIRNLECPSYEICLIDYGCGKFNRKIHIMEQYP